MQFSKIFTAFLISLLLSTALLPLRSASAKEGAESAYIKLEPFTVNLANLNQYLEIGLTLQGASPEVGAAVAMFMPKVRHEMILLLSSKDAAEILRPEGKVKLAEEIRHIINDAIDLSSKHGVTNVLFASFIVQ